MRRFTKVIPYILVLLLVVGIPACVKYDLEIQNKTDEVLDIYVDGYYEGSVAPSNYLFIRSLSLGDHHIEALDLDGRVLAEEVIYMDEDSKWIIYD